MVKLTPVLRGRLVVGGVFAALILAIGVLAYLNFYAPPPRPRASGPAAGAAPAATPPPVRAGASPAPAAEATQAATPSGALSAEMSLYFASPVDDGLVAEKRRVAYSNAGPAAKARAALGELARGSREGNIATLPEGSPVRAVYFDDESVVTVDLAADVQSNQLGGSQAEIEVVYSVVGTVLANVPEARGVRILVAGREQRTLAGHVDLSRPLVMDRTLVPEG